MASPDPLLRLPFERLERRLDAEPTDDTSVGRYRDVFAARGDSPEQLFALSTRTTNSHAAGAALVRGVLRAAERDGALALIPPKVDRGFEERKFVQESWVLGEAWDGLPELCAAVKALGAERGRALTQRLLARDTSFGVGCLLLHLFPDTPALVDAAMARLATWAFPTSEVSMGLSLLPLEALPHVVAHLDGLPPSAGGKNLVRIGLQCALARAAGRGDSWDASLDRHLGARDVWVADDFMFTTYAAPVLRAAVGGLGPERARAWLEAALDASEPGFVRALRVVPLEADELVAAALAFCARSPKAVRKPGWEWLSRLAAELGERAAQHAAALPKGKVRASFEAGAVAPPAAAAPTLPAEPVAEPPRAKPRARASAAQAVERLARAARAAAPTAPLVPVTILEAVRGARPSGVSRVGGPGFDLGARQPALESLPMTHVLTLDAAEVPAARAAFPEASALALYVSEPKSNEAFEPYTEQVAVLPLDAADLARGAAVPTVLDLPLAGLRCTTVEVPAEALRPDAPGHRALYRALCALPARAGGPPAWLQRGGEDEREDGFVLQFDARFAPLAMGDQGVFYVFEDTAFWQSL